MELQQDFLKAILAQVEQEFFVCKENGELHQYQGSETPGLAASQHNREPENWSSLLHLHYSNDSGLLALQDIPLYSAWKGVPIKNYEMLLKAPGQPPWLVRASASPVKDNTGNNIGAVMRLQYTGLAKETQLQVPDIELFNQKVADITPALITVFDINTGKYLYVNDALENFLGYYPTEFLQGGLEFAFSLIHPEDAVRIREENLQAIILANSGDPLYRDRLPVPFEYRVRHKNGHYTWVQTFGAIFSRNEAQQVAQVINISFDITQRKEAVLKALDLKVSGDYFRDLADQSPFMIWKVDQKGLCNYVNARWCETTGLSFANSMNLGWSVAFHPEDAQREYLKFMDCFRQEVPYFSKFRIRKHKGDYCWVLAQSNPLLQEEKGYIGSLTDITAQEQAFDSMRLLMQKKDEFLSIASHELKTPITSMKAVLQVAQRVIVSNESLQAVHPFVERANKQVNKLTRLVDDLLDVTKITAGKMQFNSRAFLLKEVIDDCLDALDPGQAKHRVQVEGDTAIMLHADKERLEQVLSNLLSNAVKYSPDSDRVQLTIVAREKELEIAIADSGIGIAADKLPYIFDRFFRVQDSSQQFAGLGLGLFISSEIVSRLGGSITVVSKEGEGSTFIITLPLIPETEKEEMPGLP